MYEKRRTDPVRRFLPAGVYIMVDTLENEYVLGFAQTHQGLCPWTLPPFEKGGPKLYFFSCVLTI